jgi:hypothetical protein
MAQTESENTTAIADVKRRIKTCLRDRPAKRIELENVVDIRKENASYSVLDIATSSCGKV